MLRNVNKNNNPLNNSVNRSISDVMTCNKSTNKSIIIYLKRVLFVLIISLFFILLFLSLIPISGANLPPLPSLGGHKSSKLNTCQRCKLLTESFGKVSTVSSIHISVQSTGFGIFSPLIERKCSTFLTDISL